MSNHQPRKVVLEAVRPVAYAEGYALYGKPISTCSCGHTDVWVEYSLYLNPIYATNASVRATTHHNDQMNLAGQRGNYHSHSMTFFPLSNQTAGPDLS